MTKTAIMEMSPKMFTFWTVGEDFIRFNEVVFIAGHCPAINVFYIRDYAK